MDNKFKPCHIIAENSISSAIVKIRRQLGEFSFPAFTAIFVIASLSVCFGAKTSEAGTNPIYKRDYTINLGFIRTNNSLSPEELIPSPDGQRLYAIISGEPDIIQVISTKVRKVISKINVGMRIRSIRLSNNGDYLYVCARTPHEHVYSLLSLSTKELKIVDRIPMGSSVRDWAWSKSNESLYVLHMNTADVPQFAINGNGPPTHGSDEVSIISAKTKKIMSIIPVQKDPSNFILSHNGKRLYVMSNSAPAVLVISTKQKKVVSEINLKFGSSYVSLLSPNGRYLYLGTSDDHYLSSVQVISTISNSLVKVIPISKKSSLGDLKISNDGRHIYAKYLDMRNFKDTYISAISTQNNRPVFTTKLSNHTPTSSIVNAYRGKYLLTAIPDSKGQFNSLIAVSPLNGKVVGKASIPVLSPREEFGTMALGYHGKTLYLLMINNWNSNAIGGIHATVSVMSLRN